MTGTDIDDIPSYPCPICRTLCHPFDGIFEGGRWYHERCYVHHLGIEVERLRKKFEIGNITLEEAKELKVIEPMYKQMRTPKKESDIRRYKEPPKFQGNTIISLMSASTTKTNKAKTKLLTGEK